MAPVRAHKSRLSRRAISFRETQDQQVAKVPASGTPTEKAFPVDTSAVLARLVASYEKRKKPIRISFRKLVSWIKAGERATHYVHPYPAKLLPQIAHFFLAASSLLKPDDQVLDPFGGSGTVALETILSGRDAIYADINPLAHLVAKTKTSAPSTKTLNEALARVKGRFLRYEVYERPDVVNLDLWYTPAVIRELAKLRRAIEAETESKEKNFLLVTFSAVARKVSKADPRFSVPVRTNENHLTSTSRRRINVWEVFQDQFSSNFRRVQKLSSFDGRIGTAHCILSDAKELLEVNDASIGFVITSPPYAGAQKYVRATSLSLGWLGLKKSNELRILEDSTIGREHFVRPKTVALIKTSLSRADKLIGRIFKKNPTRATIASTYLIEMKMAISQLGRVVKPNGHVVFVIGDNVICGEVFPSSQFLRSFFEDAGFTTKLELVDEIHSRGLMTKRNHTASVIRKEHIFVFHKTVDQ